MLPWRSLPGSAAQPDPRRAAKLVGTTFRTKEYVPGCGWKALFHEGLAKRPELVDVRRQALALLETVESADLADVDLDVLAVAAATSRHIMPRDADPFAAIVARARGVATAVEVDARSRAYDSDSENYTRWIAMVPAGERRRSHERPSVALRHVVVASSAEAHAEALARAEALFATEPRAMQRALIRCAFPEEPPFAGALVDACEVGATRSIAEIDAWCATHGFQAVSTYALGLACVLPPDESVPMFARALAALLVKPKHGPLMKTPPREVVDALIAVGTAEAREVLAPHAKHPVLATQLNAFLREAPPPTTKLAKKTAKKADTPALLRERPWRAKPAALSAVPGLALRGVDAETIELVRPPRPIPTTRPPTPAELAAWRRREGYHFADCIQVEDPEGWQWLPVTDADVAEAWSHPEASLGIDPVSLVARLGVSALDGFLLRDHDWLDGRNDDAGRLEALRSFVSPRLAPLFARLARKRHVRGPVMAWFERHLVAGANGLVHAALAAGDEDATEVLRTLVRRGHGPALVKVAAGYGAKAKASLAAFAGAAPLALGTKPPKLPDYLDLARLPPVTLRAGGVLDEDGRAALVELFSVVPIDEGYPGLAELREACADLEAFALALLEEWVLAGANGRHEWMLFAIVHVPGPASEQRLVELARASGAKNRALAERLCEALGALGTDRALVQLAHLAETSRFANLRKDARALLAGIARARGLTSAQLEDRTVPREAATKKERAAILQRQVRRLEAAMITGFTWTPAELEERLVRHPLLAEIARSLVLESAGRTFRIAEDGTAADVTDAPFAPSAPVRIAHPARTSLEGWSSVIADYDILQPFEQVARAVARKLPPADGIVVPAKKMLGLMESRGWERDDAGQVGAWLRRLGDVTARWPITPGIDIAYLADAGDVTTGPLAVDGEPDPVAVAELARDISSLRQ